MYVCIHINVCICTYLEHIKNIHLVSSLELLLNMNFMSIKVMKDNTYIRNFNDSGRY